MAKLKRSESDLETRKIIAARGKLKIEDVTPAKCLGDTFTNSSGKKITGLFYDDITRENVRTRLNEFIAKQGGSSGIDYWAVDEHTLVSALQEAVWQKIP